MSRYIHKAFPYSGPIDASAVIDKLHYVEFPVSMLKMQKIIGISPPSIEVVIYIDAIVRNKPIQAYKSKEVHRGMNYWKVDRDTFFDLIETYNKAKAAEIPFEIYKQCLDHYNNEKEFRKNERTRKSIDNLGIKQQEIIAKEEAEYEARMRVIKRIMGTLTDAECQR